jgi:hypothetical protein
MFLTVALILDWGLVALVLGTSVLAFAATGRADLFVPLFLLVFAALNYACWGMDPAALKLRLGLIVTFLAILASPLLLAGRRPDWGIVVLLYVGYALVVGGACGHALFTIKAAKRKALEQRQQERRMAAPTDAGPSR